MWYPETVRILLASPFYAGIVYFGIHKYNRDRRTGKETITHNPNPTYGKGKHQPIWDEATHQQLLDLIEQRGRGYKGDKTARLSRLLYCFCGKKLHLDRNKKTSSGAPYHYWTCSSKLPAHTAISDKKALALVIPAIVAGIRVAPDLPQPKRKQDPTADLREEIAELTKKKKRWLDLYEEEKIDPQTLTERIQRLEDQLNEASAKLAKQRASQARHESNKATRTRLAQLIDRLEGYYLQASPVQVNADLHALIERVTISKDLKIKIDWRGED